MDPLCLKKRRNEDGILDNSPFCQSARVANINSPTHNVGVGTFKVQMDTRAFVPRTQWIAGCLVEKNRSHDRDLHQENVDRLICACNRQNRGAIVQAHICVHPVWMRLWPLSATHESACIKP